MHHKHQQQTQTQNLSNPLVAAPGAKGSYVYHRADDQFGSAVTYSFFKSKNSKVPQRVTESFEEFSMRCAKPEIRARNDGPTFSPSTFSPCSVSGEYYQRECSFLAFKFERIWNFTQPEDILKCVDGLASFMYSTRSHTISSRPTGSYQLMVALRTPIPADYSQIVAMNFATRFCRLRGVINFSYMSPDQRLHFPSCTARSQRDFVVDAQRGHAYDWLPDFLEHQAPKSFEGWGMQ